MTKYTPCSFTKTDGWCFEEYFEGNQFKYEGQYHYGDRIQWHRDSLHVIHSCTKSFVSAAIGIAVDQGFIESVNQSIFDYLPDHQSFKRDGKENITIEHLLTMSSGLKWDEWSTGHGSAANDIDRLYWECDPDPVACVLERPLEAEPGAKFTYHSGGYHCAGRNTPACYGHEHQGISHGPTYLTRWASTPLAGISFRVGCMLLRED